MTTSKIIFFAEKSETGDRGVVDDVGVGVVAAVGG